MKRSKGSSKPEARDKSIKSIEPQITRQDIRKSKHYEANIIKSYYSFQSGVFTPSDFKLTGENIILKNLSKYDVFLEDPYDFHVRVTALCWHPGKPNILAIGSKWGELAFRKWVNFFGDMVELSSFEGTGPGGSITNICFDPFKDNGVFLTSVNGTARWWDYESGKGVNLMTTGTHEKWYCSISASEKTGLIVVGDVNGILTVLNKDMKQVDSYKIHKRKLINAEFSNARNWLLVTSSLDHTVKVWDIRNMKKPTVSNKCTENYLQVLQHNKAVNSAYFSKTDGNRLLTTDQHNELRVYRGPNFDLETIIYHPHRQFQHLTGIRATWHPLADLIVIGRYPDPHWPNYENEVLKSIDIIDPSSGKIKVQMVSNSLKGISSLNEMNPTGDLMASGMGMHLLYWRLKHQTDNKLPKSDNKHSDDSGNDDDSENENKTDKPPPKKPRRTLKESNHSKKLDYDKRNKPGPKNKKQL
ncbi:DNA damage-binding protein 2-like [Cimex lectularius]|uniref:DNA damage-binding protein 2 n=1 Tax=Cimex lectularius TaxID=79782 RepID=A0A8I6RMZ6_CIMLE|nr:DNA damage-binding protein 2-like [Cimex lectularius]